MSGAAVAPARLTALVCCIAGVVSCSRGEAAKTYVARADTLLAQQKYAEVIQQSQHALDAKHDDAHATALLGRAHLELGQFGQAYQDLLEARRLEPGDSAVRLDLARLYMVESRLVEAREQAATVVRNDSANLAAWILLGSTARSPGQIDVAIRNLARTQRTAADSVRAQVALASLSLRKRDTASATRQLRAALARDPKSAEAHAGLAAFLASTDQSAPAEREQAIVAALAPPRSPQRLELASFLASLGFRAEAKRWLADVPLDDSASAVTAARRLLTELQLADGDSDAAHSIAELMQRHADDAELLVQRGRLELAANDLGAAVKDLRHATQVAPKLAAAHYYLAAAELAELDSARESTGARSAVSRARGELQTALTLAPDYPEALFKLTDLKIRTGDGRGAISDLDGFVSDNPGSIRGHELLAAALAASGRTAEATETFHRLIDVDPERAESHYELGVSLQSSDKTAEAIREFEAALALSPAYADPMTQLVLLDLAAGKPAVALERVNQQIARAPQSGPLYDLLGLVQAARNDVAAAEAAYRRAVQLQPSLVDAHVRLAELYDATGRFDPAIAEADTARRLDGRNLRALMALGVGHQQRGDTALAREAYETALGLNPRFAGAANNLAYLLSEQPGQEDKALKFASQARQSAPNDPHVADTYGWILYKRGDYAHAITILRSAASKLPDSPAVLYHLGMTAQKLGDSGTARAALTKAVAASTDFEGKDEARRTLAQLK